MDDATKAKLKEAGLEGVITAFEKTEADLQAEKDARTADATKHADELKKKDEIITAKTDDIVKARQKYKKLEEMTEEEKANLSEKERELLERQEQLEADRAADAAARAERDAKERGARVDKAVAQYAGTDAELAGKIKANLERIKDAEGAITEDEVAGVVGQAFNMLGVPKSDSVVDAINNGGNGDAGGEHSGDFSETTEGKGLLEAMGLPTEVPAEGGDK